MIVYSTEAMALYKTAMLLQDDTKCTLTSTEVWPLHSHNGLEGWKDSS